MCLAGICVKNGSFQACPKISNEKDTVILDEVAVSEHPWACDKFK